MTDVNFSSQYEETLGETEFTIQTILRDAMPQREMNVDISSSSEVVQINDTDSSLSTKNDNDWLETITKAVNDSGLNLDCEGRPTIYKVPEYIRKCDPTAYPPTVVSIGPYHHQDAKNNIELQPMQDHKWRCVNKLISRRNRLRAATELIIPTSAMLENCLKAMKSLELQVRSCYSHHIEPDRKKLALMMMLDGCFILHLLLDQGRDDDEEFRVLESQVTGGLLVWQLVMYDLLLLENQIPFFVIVKLFDLFKTPSDENDNLINKALDLFSKIHLQRRKDLPSLTRDSVHHLLQLFHCTIKLEHQLQRPHQHRWAKKDFGLNSASLITQIQSQSLPKWIPSVKELEEAGVKFKKNKNAQSFMEIEFCKRFRKGLLEIPPLDIHDYSKKLFQNMIAFEQCYRYAGDELTIYAIFMDCLINHSADARLLHLYGILRGTRSARQEMTSFFSKICEQIHYASDDNHLATLFDDIDEYYNSKWHRWRAVLCRDYFSSPWTIISVGAALLVIVLTFIQTIYAVP